MAKYEREYEKDARIKRLFKMVDKLESAARSPYTQKLPDDVRRLSDQVRKDIHTIGQQLEGGGYHDQLPLVGDASPRKAVQQR